jgi:large subunit ribosomal protein L6
MSRIGNLPIKIPEGVTANVATGNVVEVKGALGTLQQKVDPEMKVEIKDNTIFVSRPTDQKRHKAMHGLYRSLISNMVFGVSKGYEVKQELVGVGYKAEVKGQILELGLGFSHPIFIQLPQEIKVEAQTERRSNPILTLKSHDKQLLGQVVQKAGKAASV